MATAQCTYLFMAIVCALLTIFSTIGIPFLISKDLTKSIQMVTGLTIIYVLFMLLVATTNVFSGYILVKNSEYQSNNFLLVCMLIGEIMIPLFYYPINLVLIWRIAKVHVFYKDSSFLYLLEAYRWMVAFSYACINFSMLCVTSFFLLNLYQMVRRSNYISTCSKIISVLVPACISVVSIFFEYMAKDYDYTWIHIVSPSISCYVPLYVMFSVLIAISVLLRIPRFTDSKPERMGLMIALYVVFFVLWLPYFTYFTYYVHNDMTGVPLKTVVKTLFVMEKLIMLKISMNVFVLILFDRRFEVGCSQVFLKCLPCLRVCQGLESVPTFRYNRDDEEVLIS